MAAKCCIPILDCSAVGLLVKDEELVDESIKIFGEELKDAFVSAGFCYLKNFGIDKKLIDGYIEASRRYFSQSADVKRKHAFTGTDRNLGWVAPETEKYSPDLPADLKEAFNYHPAHDDGEWPDLDDFMRYSQLMFERCTALAKRLCKSLSVALGLEKNFMEEAHKAIGTKKNSSILRTLHYPPIGDASTLKYGQNRLGKHTDFGSITLVFQDETGGLEADIPGEGFVPVSPIPDTVVINAGDLMQRWSSDTIKSPVHRVLMPEAEVNQRKSRQSIVCFIVPDDDWVVKPIDGSDKYAPISSKEYILQRLNAIY